MIKFYKIMESEYQNLSTYEAIYIPTDDSGEVESSIKFDDFANILKTKYAKLTVELVEILFNFYIENLKQTKNINFNIDLETWKSYTLIKITFENSDKLSEINNKSMYLLNSIFNGFVKFLDSLNINDELETYNLDIFNLNNTNENNA